MRRRHLRGQRPLRTTTAVARFLSQTCWRRPRDFFSTPPAGYPCRGRRLKSRGDESAEGECRPPLHLLLPGLTCLRIGASLVNPATCTTHLCPDRIMSDFKQLSRSVKGLTVLVTGAASGMGRATAEVFASDGANVAVTDISAEATRAVAGEIASRGGSARAWTLDVADRDNINDVVDNVAAHFGGLDIVVNNAGIS